MRLIVIVKHDIITFYFNLAKFCNNLFSNLSNDCWVLKWVNTTWPRGLSFTSPSSKVVFKLIECRVYSLTASASAPISDSFCTSVQLSICLSSTYQLSTNYLSSIHLPSIYILYLSTSTIYLSFHIYLWIIHLCVYCSLHWSCLFV